VSDRSVTWTDEAESDLGLIMDYYYENAGEAVALMVLGRIQTQINSLKELSLRARPGRVVGTHERVIVGLPYIAVLEIKLDSVLVLNLIHTAKKYP
jgi:toxin ParE1/3/4